MMADEGWQCKFVDPIPLQDGRTPVTLMEAGDYITSLPNPPCPNGKRQLSV
jgi:hypothetical protein